MTSLLRMPVEFGLELAVPSADAWAFITDTRTWPLWGPSVREVDFPDRYIRLGSRGKIRTPVGIWLPFEITHLKERSYWDWRIKGLEATGHRVIDTGPDRCKLIFTVPFWALAYGIICKLALTRIKRLIPKGFRYDARYARSKDANTTKELGGNLPENLPDQLDKETKMQIETKCFATLVDKETCDYRDSTSYDLAEGQTVGHLADMAGVARADIKTIFVNGRHADLDTMLSHGDRVGFVPAVGGM